MVLATQKRAAQAINLIVPTDPAYVCPAQGRFEHAKIANCTSYALCLKSKNTLAAYIYSYPENSYYNPSDQKCSFWYICPDTLFDTTTTITTTTERTPEITIILLEATTINPGTTNIPETTITPERKTTIPEKTTPERATTAEIATSKATTATHETTTISYTTTTIESPLTPFKCTQPGFFQNVHDKTRRSYHLCCPTCYGGLKLVEYTCPGDSVFNPQIGLCSLMNVVTVL